MMKTFSGEIIAGKILETYFQQPKEVSWNNMNMPDYAPF